MSCKLDSTIGQEHSKSFRIQGAKRSAKPVSVSCILTCCCSMLCRGRPTDVYALGACLYTLLFGRIPFSAPSLYKLFEVVQKEPVRYPEDVPISAPLVHILERMLAKVSSAVIRCFFCAWCGTINVPGMTRGFVIF